MSDISSWIDTLLTSLGGLDPLWLFVLTAVFTALETIVGVGLLVPGDLVVALAGSTVDSPGRFALVLLSATVGTLSGELLGYAMGRAAGGRIRASRFGRWVGEARWVRAERYLVGRGARILVPIRFVAVVHAVTPVVAGTVRMPFRRFVTWASLGAVVWAACYTAIGTAVGTSYREHGHIGLITSVTVLGVVGAALAVRPGRRRRNRGASRPNDQCRATTLQDADRRPDAELAVACAPNSGSDPRRT
jgi:membrane-associated protein